MRSCFHINYEFEIPEVKSRIGDRIRESRPGYVCVADGNILQMVHRDISYRETVAGAMFSICDSSWVPIYVKIIYGFQPNQYCGSQIFADLTSVGKYRHLFIGTDDRTLDALQCTLSRKNSAFYSMKFIALPFKDVEDFDYGAIAEMINLDCADIIWVALGAPKQERFMQKLEPLLERGVMIGVGAVFHFFSGVGVKRAPDWMVKSHLEFVYRIMTEPKKQISRCWHILTTLPFILFDEWRRAQSNQHTCD